MTAMLSAGLDGIDQNLSCRKDLNHINIYHLTAEERAGLNIDELPGSLAEALRELDQNSTIREALGIEMYETFKRAKWAEVEENRLKVTDWELERYLEVS
jgi:glutamine synthetase